ncbi:phosphoglycolate phosphatase [Vreelandella hamiltonii]|uniref:Phosphoglycolate phosphatase n=2 Tax=Vreelandella TaxID=3137766 RepID=A0A8H9LX46_9GAMM|nr:phosphoglycolate phosphatase [Halomonas hamiltonii]GGW24469.1 phosphoglycolate phosphatase [Halomonas hamiltonii]
MHTILQQKQLIAFDLDGTLIDSVPDLAVAVQQSMREMALPLPDEQQVRHWVGNGAQVLVERALSWATSSAPEPGLVEAALAAFMRHYAAAPNARTVLYPHVAQALQQLHDAGFTLALITNKPERFIAPILEHFELLALFAHCVGGDSLPEKKPSPAPLLHIARLLDVAPSACVMVGDSRHDIEAGKAAGFATVALPYGYNHGDPIEQSQPEVLIESLAELIDSDA